MYYQNPDLTKNQLPSLEQIRKYIQLARMRDLKYRDIRPLNSFFQRLPQVDNRFLGLLQTRKIALLGFPWEIVFDDNIKADSKEQDRLSRLITRFVRTKMHSVFSTIANGIAAGRSAVRLVWGKSADLGNYVDKKIDYEITELDFSFEDSSKLDVIRTTENGFFQRTELDPDTHIFVRHNPISGIANNEFIGSLLQSNMLLIWLKYTDMFNWSQANEKFGDPLRYAQYNDNLTDKNDLAVIMDGLKNLGTDSYAAFPDHVKVQMLEAHRQGISDMHEKLIDVLNTETSISVLGQTLTTDVSKIGSFAAAKVHNYVRQDILYGDLLLFENIITDQYIQRDWLMNYGEPKNGFPRFRFITDEAVDYESNARVAETASAFQLKVKASELYKKLGYELPEEINPDAVITLSQSSPLFNTYNSQT